VNDPNGTIKKYDISGILNASVSNAGPVPKKNAIKIVLIWKRIEALHLQYVAGEQALHKKRKNTN